MTKSPQEVLMGSSSTNIFVEPNPLLNPSYVRLFQWEKNFDFQKWRGLMTDYWFVCVGIVMVYVCLIFKGKSWMKGREPFKLRGPLILWNISLAVFSIFAFRRTVPELIHLWFRTSNGYYLTVCSRTNFSMATALYELIGIFSKVVELGDTGFIVLRKQPLRLLHWYHHATVLLYTWYTYGAFDPAHRLFMTMNYGIHIMLYLYYAAKSMGFNVSRNLAMLITCAQLAQMIVGIHANLYSLAVLDRGDQCDRDWKNIYLALAMYSSYFILFSHFFYNAYISPAKSPKAKST